MSVKVTVPNNSGDYLTFGSANTPTAAQVGGYDDGSSNGHLEFYTTASGTSTERVRITSAGNVGIGVTNPGNKMAFPNNSYIGFMDTSGGETGYIGMKSTNLMSYSDKFYTNGSGQVLINTTSTSGFVTDGGKFYIRNSGECMSLYNDTGSGWIQRMNATSNAGTFYFISFASAGTGVGAITANSTNTTYATSSDYRLKENIAPMTGALAKVAQLKPCTYTWKLDGSQGQGFIAHELQEVVPDAVVGEKDAVEEDGSIKAQAIDTSFLVATLTAAIQEQQEIINDLKARIETLEAK